MKQPIHLTRRDFLAATGMALAGGMLTPSRGMDGLPSAVRYSLDPLPYDVTALEPHIDTRTMEIHHGRHHAAYVNNLNAALERHPAVQPASLEELISDINALPSDIQTAVRNNGGGHYNHVLFWSTMSPEGGGEPEGELAEAVAETFGDFESFKVEFSRAAASRFGSGWAWLIVRPDGSLAITSTPNQDNPLMTGLVDVVGTPILGLDVWEHAYYLLYQNRRGDYISAWWSVVNWPDVGRMYRLAVG